MRKLFFPIVVLLFSFVSCTANYPGDTVLINWSSHEIILNFTGVNEITLAPFGEPGNSVSLTTLRGVNPIHRVQSFSPNKRVRYEYTNANLTFKFFDRQAYELKILNLTGQNGKLSANDWMDEIDYSFIAGDQENPNWLVYTSRPRFTAVTGDNHHSVSYRQTGNVLLVTIK